MSDDEEYIEMLWDCRHCGLKGILGREMNCNVTKDGVSVGGCGNPKDITDGDYYMPGDIQTAPAVIDPERLREAQAGEHWECPYCKGHERDGNGQCRSCAGRRTDINDDSLKLTDDQKSEVVWGEQKFETHKIAGIAGSGTVAGDGVVAMGGVVATGKVEQPRDEAGRFIQVTPFSLPDFVAREKKRIIIVGGSLTALGCFVWLMVWLFSFHQVDAAVDNLFWQHSATLEELHTYHAEDWRSDMRGNAYNKACVNKFKKNVKCHPYDCNPHKVNYDCRPHKCNPRKVSHQCNPYDCRCERQCTSGKNGYAKCHKECDTCYKTCTETEYDTCHDTCTRTEYDTCYKTCAVYEDYCHYDFDRWDDMVTKVETGVTHEVKWPDVHAVGPKQRLQTSTYYKVEFRYLEEKMSSLTCGTLEEFKTYIVGDRYNAEYNHAGSFHLLGRL